MLCVHLGPGRLGLGLVVEELLQADFDVCLVGRAGPERREALQFGLVFTDPDLGLRYRSVRWAGTPRVLDDLPGEVVDSIGSKTPLLITSALDDKIVERTPLIDEIVARRPAATETILLVCENDPNAAYRELSKRHAESLQVIPCVVDRICAWPPTGARDKQGRRLVQLHPVGEWIVPATSPPTATLQRLATAPLVHIIDGPIEGWKRRKLWTVNGVHIVLALVARVEGIDVLPLAGRYQDAFLEIARPLVAQISAAVHGTWPDVPIDDAYIADRIRAFTESPDTTARILEDRLVRADLTSFMKRLNARLGDAARAAHDVGEDCTPFIDVMDLVVSALSNLEVYYDTSGPLSTATDKIVADEFERVVRGWMPDDRAEAHVRSLERALRHHHDVLR